MPTITTRLTLWYVAVTGIIIGTVAVTMYLVYESQRRIAMDEDLRGYADFLVSDLGGETLEISDLFEQLLRATRKPKAGFRSHKFVLASQDSLVFETSNFTDPDSLISVLQGSSTDTLREGFHTMTLNGIEYRSYTRNITVGKDHGYQLVVITSMERFYDSLVLLQTIFVIIIPISLLFAGLGGWVLARRAFLPVRDITSTAAAISSASLDRRVPRGRSQDELGLLADTFNDMIMRLDETFKSQQQFIADASHDLRTPLTVVQMELELLLMRGSSDDEVRGTLERCLLEIERLNTLAADLLLLARADAKQLTLDRQTFRLDELLAECVSQLNRLARSRGLTFTVVVGEPAEITGDEALLRRSFINVLDNALKFATEGTSIEVRMETSGHTHVISVMNAGPVPADEELARIFNRFHRGDSARRSSGSGLGLAIVRAVIEAHGGTVHAESASGQGVRIVMSFPA